MSKKSEEVRCWSRIGTIRRSVDSFYESLPHPRDFHPSVADVCWILEVLKIIISGTDEEFEACEADTGTRLSELAATWVEERRNLFLTLLSRDSPILEHLSLATTSLIARNAVITVNVSKKLFHIHAGAGTGTFAKVFNDEARLPWDPGRSEYKYSEWLSNIVREIVLECGEDPDTIPTKEVIRKHLRFGTNGLIEVLSWYQVVGFGAYVLGWMLFLTCFARIIRQQVDGTWLGGGYCIASFGLANYQSIDLTLRWAKNTGVVSGVGE